MLKALLLMAPLALTTELAVAAEYGKMKCQDLAGDQLRAAQVIGWLNLSNRSIDTQDISFDHVQQNVGRLLKTCSDGPDLAMHVAAASALVEIGREERGDLAVAASPAFDPLVASTLREISDKASSATWLQSAQWGAEPFIEATTVLHEITPAMAAPPVRAAVVPPE